MKRSVVVYRMTVTVAFRTVSNLSHTSDPVVHTTSVNVTLSRRAELGDAENAFSERLMRPRVVECPQPENATYAAVFFIAETETGKVKFRVVGSHNTVIIEIEI